MLRITAFLLFLALAILSVFAVPADSTDLVSARQVTRAQVVAMRQRSPTRRANLASGAPVATTFRMMVPSESRQTADRNKYATGGSPFASFTTTDPTQSPLFQLSSSGELQLVSSPSTPAHAYGKAGGTYQIAFIPVSLGQSGGGVLLQCSVGAGNILSCEPTGTSLAFGSAGVATTSDFSFGTSVNPVMVVYGS